MASSYNENFIISGGDNIAPFCFVLGIMEFQIKKPLELK